jgi:hypothetical protein
MRLSDLPKREQQRLGREFRRAVQARAKQWDHERAIELALGRELNLEIEDWAAMIEDASVLNETDLARQLGEGPDDLDEATFMAEAYHENEAGPIF